MSIFAMKRFWIAVSLPALIALLMGKSGFVLTGIIWLPVSAGLLIWAYFTNRRDKKALAELQPQRKKITPHKKISGFMKFINFFKMKRFWIAITLPLIAIYFGGMRTFWEAGLLWMPISVISFFTALSSYLLKLSNQATVDNFNDDNDGCYSHTLINSSMKIDSNKRLIFLKDGYNEKTYSFDDIKEWQYNISHGVEIEDAGLSVTANNINSMRMARNQNETGFFISVRDIQNPEWHIRFFPKEGSFKSQQGLNSLKKQMNQWMEVFDQIVNGNKG
ncbi:DUF4755 domain-containing protein [Pectobacterium sp. 21LCBS03]|uniref:DUF4755 domain-containing protein n=1 Tax=Pectobacterium sp. 21LCBS03 TaxID=2935858 RepID=UPI00200FD493|nr:DUF4755 domain-containing protein [Pectobacterium sp. 21LCBS03]UPY94991.1 DUF4755 domain-containing protein [Pectobacterium sp. 21LCBS03]